MHFKFQFIGESPLTTRDCCIVQNPPLQPDTVALAFKLQFIAPMIGVTFLCTNKKVTKEVVIGEAFVSRSRAPNAPSPMYPTSAHLEIAQQLNDVTAPLYGLTDGGGSALAALPILFSTSGDAAGVS